jgi:hypothetical protein
MVDFVLALQTAGAALNVLKELNRADREYDKAALKLEVAKLSTAIVDLQIALAEARDESIKKDREIARLQEAFIRREELIEVRGFHFQRTAEGKPYGKAFCPRCLAEGRFMQVFKTDKNPRIKACPECRREYQVSDYPYPDEATE